MNAQSDSLFGLTKQQIYQCIEFYEIQTGRRAIDIAEKPIDSVEKLLHEIASGEFTVFRAELTARAKKLLGEK